MSRYQGWIDIELALRIGAVIQIVAVILTPVFHLDPFKVLIIVGILYGIGMAGYQVWLIVMERRARRDD